VLASGMPDALTRGDVARIAARAHLDLSDDEADLLGRQLTDILTFAGRIAEVDTTGVPPAAGTLAEAPACRPDEAGASLTRAEALAGAPETDEAGGFFKVPRVIG
jgi:aspartyl/glutamyl-tRNA(Asn/Gln) amidotransferase C subunit